MKKSSRSKSLGRLHKMDMTIIFYNIIVCLGWCAAPAQCQSFIQTGTALHNSLFVSMDEKIIAIGTDASEIGLWDVNTRKKTRVLKRGKSKPRTYDKEMAQQIKIENTDQGNVLFRSSDIRLVPNNTEAERVYNLMREWFVDLRPGSGATVLSSASGLQTAAEGEQWKNGVFTWCLLNGLRDRKADKNGDGAIMISELQEYLATEVPKQTNGRQQPAFRVENLSNDWQIW